MKPTNEIINKITQLYKEGYSSEVIGQKFGHKAQTITKYLKANNVVIRGPKKKLDVDDKKEMCHLYKDGWSAPKIAEKYNVSDALVLRYLKQQGIKSRTAEEAHRKYAINENFFDSIDTEEKAYFLGFLYADGCNHLDANYVSLGLEYTDQEILVKLSSLIYLENPGSHVKLYDRTCENKGVEARLCINSKHICSQLEKLGCPQAKTFKIEYPEWMPTNLHQHFIRGYFDGDGCLHLNKILGRSSYWKITSTKSFATSVKNIIENTVDVNIGIYLSTNNSTVFDAQSAGDRQVEKISKWIYNNATIFMKRKYDLFLNLLNEIEKTNLLIETGTRGYSKSILTK